MLLKFCSSKLKRSLTLKCTFSIAICKRGDNCIKLMNNQPKKHERKECNTYEDTEFCYTKYSTELEIENSQSENIHNFINNYKNSLNNNHTIISYKIHAKKNSKVIRMDHEIDHCRCDCCYGCDCLINLKCE